MENRPVYEDEQDRLKEEELKSAIEILTKSKLEKLPVKYNADYLAFRDDKPVSIIEIKCRNIVKDKYPTYMISLHKVVNILLISEALKVPFLLFVKWEDIVGFVQIDRGSIEEVKMQSINFRNDNGDIEPCIFIPLKKFKEFKK